MINGATSPSKKMKPKKKLKGKKRDFRSMQLRVHHKMLSEDLFNLKVTRVAEMVRGASPKSSRISLNNAKAADHSRQNNVVTKGEADYSSSETSEISHKTER